MSYVFFNKGFAYSYMAEILLVLGMLILFINRKHLELGLDNKQILVGIFIFVSSLFILAGVFQYQILNVLRDSLAFQYAWFAFIIYFFKNEYDFIWQKILQIYKWAPLVIFLNFFLFYFVFLYLPPINIFGNQNIIIYKNVIIFTLGQCLDPSGKFPISVFSKAYQRSAFVKLRCLAPKN